MKNGRIKHAELRIGDNIIMIAAPTEDYESINNHKKHCKGMNQWLQTPYIVNDLSIYMEDVSVHYTCAEEIGAKILSRLQEGFRGKRYRCVNVESHRWMFMQMNKEL